MITIVTSRSYLLCEAINYINIQADPEWSQGSVSKLLDFYRIDIEFIPLQRGQSPHSSGKPESREVTIKILGEKTAMKLYKELVAQIREQMPDQMYLDKMMDDILSGGKDIHDDTSTVKIDPARSAKRNGKAVLRKSSKRR